MANNYLFGNTFTRQPFEDRPSPVPTTIQQLNTSTFHMAFVFGFFPVIIFLGCLFLLDSFKLVKVGLLLVCLGWGLLSAGISYILNTNLATLLNLDFYTLSRYVAPVVEEMIKFSMVFFLIARRQIGFMVDAAIYGFAIGTGFALAENLWYYWQLGTDFNTILAIVRGFGTAIMHGGTIAICAIILIEGVQRSSKMLITVTTGLLAAIMIHTLFNQFMVNPFIQTMLIIILLPLVFYFVFMISTSQLQKWLEVEFSNEVDMLSMIRKGRLKDSKAGNYLSSLKEHFEPVVLVDMYCYFSLYLELSIKAKRNILLKESGIPVIIEPDIKCKLTEIKTLRKQIGKAGEMALMPLVRMQHRELWKLNQLE
jgi:protease PrsW